MSGDLVISLCLNTDSDFVDTFQIPYDITWPDLEAMMKAQFDSERLSVTYIDSDNDEVSIGSQEELFEAFRVAMKAGNTLQLRVMTLDPETAVFRMPDESIEDVIPEQIKEPLDLREICPDPNVAIALQDKEKPENADSAEPQLEEPTEEQKETGPSPLTIVMPDCDQKVVISKDSIQWQKPEPLDTEEEKEAYVDTEEDLSTRSDQLLAYSDFVTFMTKLKKELRCEIVRDVTRKTVKQVLKGLDGAVIESLQGSSLLAQGSSSSGSQGAIKSNSKEEHAMYVHDGVFCDNCNNVIVGPRYKCGNCLDFDLCESCEAKPGVHNQDHVYVKIRRPCYRVGVQDGTRKPLLRAEIYKTHRKCGTKLLVPILGEPTENENEINFRLESKMKDIFARNEDKRRKKDEKKLEKLKWKAEKLKRRMECRNDPPLKRERLEIMDDDNTIRYDFYKVLMGAEVLACLNIPDGTKLQPDTKFTKTWKVKNSGDGPWTESTKLRLLWGNIPVPEPEQDVPHLKPGEQGEITVSCISPAETGEYQSHWKLYEHGMGFGARIWCSIVVVPRETLEPTTDERDSLKVVEETTEKWEAGKAEAVLEDVEPERIEISYKPTPVEHLREVVVKREDSQGTVQQEPEKESIHQDIEEGISQQEVKEATSHHEDEDCGKQEVKDEDNESENGEGFVVYDKNDDADVFEVKDMKETKKLEESQSIEDDLTTAVARLTLESETRTGTEKASHTATPHNTPYDVTPMKTPNPEPEESAEPMDLKRMSNSSSVELVPNPETEDSPQETAEQLVRQRMASLELKPDIDLESVSSYSDDEENDDEDSSLSDNDYIIVPLPECFDISKPLNQSFSSYSNSIDRTVSLDTNHNTLTDRASRADSVDDMFNTSVSLPTRPLSPTPPDFPSLTSADQQEVEERDASATSEVVVVKGDNSENLEQSFQLRGAETAEIQTSESKPDTQIQSELVQAIEADSSGFSPLGDGTSSGAGVSSPDESLPLDGSSSESGAASAPSAESETEVQTSGEATGEDTDLKKPARPHRPDNVQYVKARKHKRTQSPPKLVDFAPDFANQLVTTAVSAAGQALITAKAVFKTWQDNKQAEAKDKSRSKSVPSSGKCTPPTGWKPASTQYVPPTQEEPKPATAEWKPQDSTFTPPKSEWKPPVPEFKPPKSDWKPPAETEEPVKEQWKPPMDLAPTTQKQWTPPNEKWSPPKDTGPMGQLFEMGFYDRELNQKLLNEFNNDLAKVIQELLAKKNADWSV